MKSSVVAANAPAFGSTSFGNELFPSFKKIWNTVHHHVVPHESNNFHPAVAHYKFLGLLAVFSVAIKVAGFGLLALSPAAASSSAITPDTVYSITNQERAASTLSPLRYNSKLAQAAEAKANDMVKNGYFAHTSPQGLTPWNFIKNTNYEYLTAGENLAVDFTQAESVGQAWMQSPGHRANILNRNYEDVGIGVARGMYNGQYTTFVVQMFGQPAASNLALLSEASFIQTAFAREEISPIESSTAPAEGSTLQILDAQTTAVGSSVEVRLLSNTPLTQATLQWGSTAVPMQSLTNMIWKATVPKPQHFESYNLTASLSGVNGDFLVRPIAVLNDTPIQSFVKSVQSDALQPVAQVLGAVINIAQVQAILFSALMIGLLLIILSILTKHHKINNVGMVGNTAFAAMLVMLVWVSS